MRKTVWTDSSWFCFGKTLEETSRNKILKSGPDYIVIEKIEPSLSLSIFFFCIFSSLFQNIQSTIKNYFFNFQRPLLKIIFVRRGFEG